ncbi:uncharacterized protein CMU_011490 [Cryptosporidium muris RN66]|uniref:Small-subunit processome Utp12 domain-containing protein n=1 Tax=Cryptosporidium muris (strain RN66) TaxID=441375 RepID=B6AJ08_CRYMR|nr:uncharacterized protein CMU_011490 [Cryptosporidium muris RN66]EEA08199.1 hypothetical protein, conserved [Cryptosporidium muris RN66]|eukprot:XP_002142548.1 hypothetical protein [Cryptosporidium muris RN66]
MTENLSSTEDLEINKRKYRKLNEKGLTKGGLTISLILYQGIRSKDKQLIEDALTLNNKVIIDESIKDLDITECCDLFNEIIQKIQSNPMRLLQISNWFVSILEKIAKLTNINSKYNEKIIEYMSKLHEIITSRLSCNNDLINLQSILDLFLNITEENKIMNNLCETISTEANSALITHQIGNIMDDLVSEQSLVNSTDEDISDDAYNLSENDNVSEISSKSEDSIDE